MDEVTEKAVAEALAAKSLTDRISSAEAEIHDLKERLKVYDGWKNNTFMAALGLAGIVLAQPFLRFWHEVAGK